jgi:hypothetical protein
MSAQVLDIYERLAQATDDRTRARIIAEAFGALEDRYPQLSDLATRTHLTEIEYKLAKDIERTRLELTKEIEQVRLELTKEIEQVRLQFTKEIEQVRAELKETELRLAKEIEQVHAGLQIELARTRTNILQWSFVFWLTQFAAILALLWRVWPAS